MMKECVTMQHFQHPNVLSLIGVCVDAGPAPYMVMPFMENGSLLSIIKNERANLVIPDESEPDLASYNNEGHA